MVPEKVSSGTEPTDPPACPSSLLLCSRHFKTEWHKALIAVWCSLVLWVRSSGRTQPRGVRRPPLGRTTVRGRGGGCVTQIPGGPNHLDASSFPCLTSAWEGSKMTLSWDCPPRGRWAACTGARDPKSKCSSKPGGRRMASSDLLLEVYLA